MKLYHFEFDGMALGGVTVLVATSEAYARRKLETKLTESRLERSIPSIRLISSTPVEDADIVYFWDGDY